MTRSQVLDGDLDFEALHAWTPRDDLLKGMFFGDMVAMLSKSGWEEVRTKLDQPPKLGRFVPFSAYPIRDLQLIQRAVVAEKYPRLGLREGFRRLGRLGIETFRKSTVGTVIFATLTDPTSALKKYPEARNLLTRAGTVTTESTGARSAVVRYDGYHGIAEYDAGLLEGVVEYFDASPTSAIELDDVRARYAISW